MVELIQGAFRDAVPLLKSRRTLYIVMAALCAIAGILLLLLPASETVAAGNSSTTQMPRLQFAFDVPDVLGGLAVFFIYPSVVRSVRPEFRMTVGRFFGMLGVSIVVGVVCMAGFMLFIIPGFWIGIKWSLSLWTYLVDEGKNPFGESWEITTGQFWETFAFFVFLELCIVPMLVVMFIVAALAGVVPILGVVLLPIAFLIYLYALHVILLGTMRWMLRLRERARAGPAMLATI
jgi:hypothetical protein